MAGNTLKLIQMPSMEIMDLFQRLASLVFIMLSFVRTHFTVSFNSKLSCFINRSTIRTTNQELFSFLYLILQFAVEFQLNITNCAKVSIFPEAFANTSFHGYFENIRDFQLQERAFSKSRAKVLIQNSRMDELQRLDASLKEIKFCNTYIGEIKTNAFDVLNLDSIVFDNCQINTIQSNALTEKVCSIYFWSFITPELYSSYLNPFSYISVAEQLFRINWV